MNCNCNNMGSSCGGCGRGNGVLATMQTGDTFPVYLAYKEDDIEAALGAGESILMAVYDYKGNRAMTFSTAEGNITLTEDGYYKLMVTHEQSMMLVGKAYIELTITDEGQTPLAVYHGDKVTTMEFEPRRNNEIV